jgi:uncharacterized membrane protein
MVAKNYIRHPLEWTWDQLKLTAHGIEATAHAVGGDTQTREAVLQVRRIGLGDLRDALVRGVQDFAAYRTDVIFLCLIYPIMGLVMARLAFGYQMVPLIFPLISGFALIGPLAAAGLYEMSRRHEQGGDASWADAFGVFVSPALGAMVVLGALLLAIFAAWIITADALYKATLGPLPPVSIGAFLNDVFTTGAGWTMMVVGVGIGFLFALLVLTISVVSFPLLLDRDVGLYAAMATSVRAVAANPVTMAVWGMIVAGALVIGTIPFMIGLIIVIPVLGHATWHLYRKVVEA